MRSNVIRLEGNGYYSVTDHTFVDTPEFEEWFTINLGGWPPSPDCYPKYLPNCNYVLLDDEQYIMFKLRFA